MIGQTLKVDYLIAGAGAVGMAFADQLLTESDATIAIVDRRHQPGGHWNDAYPFVKLHQPSSAYGVNSKALGSGRIDGTGLNAGYTELASGSELVSYFEALMRERFLPSGRVQYLPLHNYASGEVTSLVNGERMNVEAGRKVDATLTSTEISAARPPPYEVFPDVVCRPPNELPDLVRPAVRYCVIGAGKTAIDACCWLLEQGTDPDHIRWIAPRDPWLMDRGLLQTDHASIATTLGMNAAQMEAVAASTDVDDLFNRLEMAGVLGRIDLEVTPSAYRCAIVSRLELEQLRRIKDVVRLGHVQMIDGSNIGLEGGMIPAQVDALYIDCTACGIAWTPPRKVFDGDLINIQMIRTCQPTFSAALTAHVEVAYKREADKNRLCAPIPMARDPIDWLRSTAADLANRQRLSKEPGMNDWMSSSRLDGMRATLNALGQEDIAALQNLKRYGRSVAAAAAKLNELLAAAA